MHDRHAAQTTLINHLRRYRLQARATPALSLGDREALASLACLHAPDGTVLSTCRNGVYRSSLIASSLSAEGVRVLSEGTHSGLSYEFLLAQLQDSDTKPGEGGLAFATFDQPANLLVLCVDGESRDELEEIEGILDWLGYLVNDTCLQEFALLILEGPEEQHLYY